MGTLSDRNTTFDALKHAPWNSIEPRSANMAVGDINSNKRGSGARANGNKLPMDLIPVSVWRKAWRDELSTVNLMDVMHALEAWQRGENKALDTNLATYDLGGACRVLEYGSKKFAAWNWAKGMQWSVPLGCALRHIRAHLDNEEYDEESGLPHLDHVLCNIIMLDHFLKAYPEGDDRPIFDEDMEGNV
jgi:hypothetical protein